MHRSSRLRSLSLRVGVFHPNTRMIDRLLGPCFKTGRLRPLRQRPCRSADLARGAPYCERGYNTPEGATFPAPLSGGPRRRWPARRRVDRSEDRRNTADKSGSKRFPFNNFTCFLTLFPKYFSSFDHSTCALSVSGRYLALEEIYLPFRAAFPNNSTRRRSYVEGASRPHTGFSPSMTSCSKELRPAATQKHPLQITTRACARFQI
jgi:hypothetical protein